MRRMYTISKFPAMRRMYTISKFPTMDICLQEQEHYVPQRVVYIIVRHLV